jgi:hypothetical protein
MSEFLTTQELAKRWRISVPTLKRWRRINYGPQPVKLGVKIFYNLDHINYFEKECIYYQKLASYPQTNNEKL